MGASSSVRRKPASAAHAHGSGAVPLLQIKVLVIGPPRVGKTALIIQFAKHQAVLEYDPTIEDTFDLVDDDAVSYELWDVGGAEEYASMRPQWFQRADAVAFLFDVTRRATFDELRGPWLAAAREAAVGRPGAAALPRILVGNKCDQASARQVPADEAAEAARSLGCDEYLETSAIENENVEEVMHALVRAVRLRRAGDVVELSKD